MKISPNGIAIIKKFEGCRLKAYRDIVGVWTIGYGITSSVGYGRIKRGMTISQATADEWLVDGLAKYEDAVNKALTRPANQNQYDALVSLCWNIGQGGLTRSSIIKFHNAGDEKSAAQAFMMWVKAGGKVNKGLTNRRLAEMALYAKAAPAALKDTISVKSDLPARVVIPEEPKALDPPPAAVAPSVPQPTPIATKPSIWLTILALFRSKP
jgi:lysozyme